MKPENVRAPTSAGKQTGVSQQNPSGTAAYAPRQSPDVRVQSKPVGRVTQRKAWQRVGASMYGRSERRERTLRAGYERRLALCPQVGRPGHQLASGDYRSKAIFRRAISELGASASRTFAHDKTGDLRKPEAAFALQEIRGSLRERSRGHHATEGRVPYKVVHRCCAMQFRLMCPAPAARSRPRLPATASATPVRRLHR